MNAKGLLFAATASIGLLSMVSFTSAQSWFPTSTPITNWTSVACSADGRKIFAAGAGGVYSSADGGTTWNLLAHAPSVRSIAASADGSKLVAIGGGFIYASTNAGLAWVQTTAPYDRYRYYVSVASSSDGVKLIAAARSDSPPFGGPIYVSTNAGADWQLIPETQGPWLSIVASAGGQTFVAAGFQPGPGLVIPAMGVSTDGGTTFTNISTWYDAWRSVALSGNGFRTRHQPTAPAW